MSLGPGLPVPNKPTVSVDVKQYFNDYRALYTLCEQVRFVQSCFNVNLALVIVSMQFRQPYSGADDAFVVKRCV